MIPCTCFVQADQIADQRSEALQSRLTEFSERRLGAPAEINWITVPKGSGFTAAKPSTSAVVSFRAASAVPQDERVMFLNEICDLWMAETGCALDEIVAVVNDPAP